VRKPPPPHVENRYADQLRRGARSGNGRTFMLLSLPHKALLYDNTLNIEESPLCLFSMLSASASASFIDTTPSTSRAKPAKTRSKQPFVYRPDTIPPRSFTKRPRPQYAQGSKWFRPHYPQGSNGQRPTKVGSAPTSLQAKASFLLTFFRDSPPGPSGSTVT